MRAAAEVRVVVVVLLLLLCGVNPSVVKLSKRGTIGIKKKRRGGGGGMNHNPNDSLSGHGQIVMHTGMPNGGGPPPPGSGPGGPVVNQHGGGGGNGPGGGGGGGGTGGMIGVPLNGGHVRCCAGCGVKIIERFLLHALDRYWHTTCLKCSCCGATLADIGSSCFTRAGMILCKNDYIR